MQDFERHFASGVTCLFSKDHEAGDIRAALERLHTGSEFNFALVYFSQSHWHAGEISEIMATHAPGLPYAGCSTAGELTPAGMREGEILIILFPKTWFEMKAFTLTDEGSHDMEDVVTRVRTQTKRFFATENNASPSSPAVLCLMDGMSNIEEAMTAALHWGLDDIPLLGGSAGDNLNFSKTTMLLDGEVISNSAIIIMIKSRLPFKVFKTENFVPTLEKLVVTKSQPDERIVLEFNGAPAAQVYAETIGTTMESLTPQSFASHPLVVKVGGEYYCRSIQKVNEDGSLTFFCAIDDGIVLTMAEPQGMVETTRKKLLELDGEMGGIDFILGFDCILRKIDARNRQVTHTISETYKEHNLIGFNTYGEQYRSMHLNQTLTGIAFSLVDEV